MASLVNNCLDAMIEHAFDLMVLGLGAEMTFLSECARQSIDVMPDGFIVVGTIMWCFGAVVTSIVHELCFTAWAILLFVGVVARLTALTTFVALGYPSGHHMVFLACLIVYAGLIHFGMIEKRRMEEDLWCYIKRARRQLGQDTPVMTRVLRNARIAEAYWLRILLHLRRREMPAA